MSSIPLVFESPQVTPPVSLAGTSRGRSRVNVLFAWVLNIGSTALAETGTPPFTLNWSAVDACAARPNVQALVGNAAGDADVAIDRDGDKWRLTMIFRAPIVGQRSLSADSCAEAADAAKLLLKLGARGLLPEVNEALPPPAPAAPSRPFFWLGLLGGMQALALPQVGARLGAQLWAGIDAFTFLFSLRTGLPRSFRGGPTDGSAVEVHPILEGVLSPCLSHQWGRVRLAGCADIELGWWRLRGLNVTSPSSGNAPSVAVGPSIQALFQLGSVFSITGSAAGRATLLKPQAIFSESGVALQRGPWVLDVTVGLSVRL